MIAAVMGTGKSAMTVYLCVEEGFQVVLILCPLRVVQVWKPQFEMHSALQFLVVALDDTFSNVKAKRDEAQRKINLAKSQIQSIIARFLGVIQSIMSINPHTATLPHPMALEIVIRDRSAADVSSVPPAYVNTFRAVPQAGNIAPQDRDLTDMDDAMAQDNLMMLKESDQSQDLQLQLANQIESLVGNPDINISAPGASPLITAAAVAGQIQSQAVTQKMLAAMLRQEAARVAHDNAIRKRNAAYAGQLQTDMTNVLQHR